MAENQFPNIYSPVDAPTLEANGGYQIPPASTFTNVVQLRVLPSMEGFIRWLELMSDNWGVTVFTIKVNGIPLKDYDKIVRPYSMQSPVNIRIPVNGVLTLDVQNTDPAAINVSWHLKGWQTLRRNRS